MTDEIRRKNRQKRETETDKGVSEGRGHAAAAFRDDGDELNEGRGNNNGALYPPNQISDMQ